MIRKMRSKGRQGTEREAEQQMQGIGQIKGAAVTLWRALVWCALGTLVQGRVCAKQKAEGRRKGVCGSEVRVRAAMLPDSCGARILIGDSSGRGRALDNLLLVLVDPSAIASSAVRSASHGQILQVLLVPAVPRTARARRNDRTR